MVMLCPSVCCFVRFIKLPLVQYVLSDKSEIKSLTQDWGYGNMLLCQGYDTLHGLVADEYGARVEWWLAGEALLGLLYSSQILFEVACV